MTQSNNRAAKLGTFRELQSSIQKAISEGHFVGDDDGKLHLLKKAEESRIPQLLRQFWSLKHGCDLPPDQELLKAAEIQELFKPAKTTRRQRPYEKKPL